MLFINYSLAMGGIEKMIIDFVLALPQEKYEIHVAVFEGGGILEDSLKDLEIPVHYLNKGSSLDWTLVFRLKKLLRDNRIDIVHTNNYGTWFYSTIARMMPGGRVGSVHTEHSLVEGNKRRRFVLENLLSRRTKHVIAVSEQVRALMIEHCKIREDRIQVIHNGIDTDRFSPDASRREVFRAEFEIPQDCLLLGSISRLAPVKDHMTMLRAFSRLQSGRKDLRLVIVGDGECKTDISNYIRERQLEDSVVLTGERQDTPSILAAMDIYVMSSLSEGMSIGLLEAMSSGLPVVVTNVGGNPELVDPRQNGLLVPANDPESMSEAIGSLLDDAEERRRMAAAGRDKVKTHFSRDIMIENYSSLYDRLIPK